MPARPGRPLRSRLPAARTCGSSATSRRLRAISRPDPPADPRDDGPAPGPAWTVKELAARARRARRPASTTTSSCCSSATSSGRSSGGSCPGSSRPATASSATSFQLDRRLFAGDSDGPARGPPRHPRDRVRHGPRRDRGRDPGGVDRHRRGRPAERRVVLSRGLARLSAARAAELRERLQALEESSARRAPTPSADGATGSCSPSTRCRGPAAAGDDDTEQPSPTAMEPTDD